MLAYRDHLPSFGGIHSFHHRGRRVIAGIASLAVGNCANARARRDLYLRKTRTAAAATARSRDRYRQTRIRAGRSGKRCVVDNRRSRKTGSRDSYRLVGFGRGCGFRNLGRGIVIRIARLVVVDGASAVAAKHRDRRRSGAATAAITRGGYRHPQAGAGRGRDRETRSPDRALRRGRCDRDRLVCFHGRVGDRAMSCLVCGDRYLVAIIVCLLPAGL